MASRRYLRRRKNNYLKLFSFIFGPTLIIISLAIPVITFAPVFKAEINYRLNNSSKNLNPVDPNFSIVIPKINANTKVLENIDPFNSKIYQQVLTQGVAHAKGSSTPDKNGNVFIFAHSAGNWYQANQYNAVFYLLNKLKVGDQIDLYYHSQKYSYSVTQSKIVNNNQIEYLYGLSDKKQVTLMTCWPPGTTLKRLIIIAQKND